MFNIHAHVWWLLCVKLVQGMHLKGQMVDCRESEALMFVGSPLIDGLDSLTSRGLYLADVPIHDATRDVILVGEQSRAQVSVLCNFIYYY